MNISWFFSPEWNKQLTIDDVCKGGEDCSGCGGLFLNFEGRWLKGHVRKIEVCDAFHVELWDMYHDLDIVWRERIPKLIVKNYSKILINMTIDNWVNFHIVAAYFQPFVFWLSYPLSSYIERAQLLCWLTSKL